MVPEIVYIDDFISVPSLPNLPVKYAGDTDFAYYELQNTRDSQEDALVRHMLVRAELTTAGPCCKKRPFTPVEIALRLWTTYRILDKPNLKSGTTASTTVYDGYKHLITATLGDAVAFAVVYGKDGIPLRVLRLNSILHRLTNLEEVRRIQRLGGVVEDERIVENDGLHVHSLALSRSIGDELYKESGVCSAAKLDILSLDDLVHGIGWDKVGLIQIISTCDGFTDGAGSHYQSKLDQERYLLDILRTLDLNLRPDVLARVLVETAKLHGSTDNISVAIQNLDSLFPRPLLIGVYDGHGGVEASIHVGQNIGAEFKKQCALSNRAYINQAMSAHNNRRMYDRDNAQYPPSFANKNNYYFLLTTACFCVSFGVCALTIASLALKDVVTLPVEGSLGLFLGGGVALVLSLGLFRKALNVKKQNNQSLSNHQTL